MNTHCGHDQRFIISADEGTSYCLLCELVACLEEVKAINQNEDVSKVLTRLDNNLRILENKA